MTATVSVLVALGIEAAVVRICAEQHRGVPGSGRSGEVTASFGAAVDASRAAIGIQQSAAARPERTGALPRIGVAVGEGDDDRPSHALTVARTLAAGALPGQILVDELATLLLAGRDDVELDARSDVTGADGRAIRATVVTWVPLPVRPKLRVIVADDASLVRAGLTRLLAEEGFEVLAEAGDADELVAAVDADPPDLVVTDIRMPPTNTDDGLRAAALIRTRHPRVAVLVLSQHLQVREAARLLEGQPAGVGYLLKERVAAIEDFADTCRRVASGEQVLDAVVADELMRLRRGGDPLEQLTERERDVLALMAQGRSNTAIAAALHVSGKTVETHVGAILAKLELGDNPDEHRRVAAVVRWLEARH